MKSISNILTISIILCLCGNINSINSQIEAKSIESFCDKNIYKIIININNINKNLKDYINFYLNTYTINNNLLFKCMIDPQKMQIICITNLQHQKLKLKVDDAITLPYPFPEIEGISWDYFSFISLVYRKSIRLTEECGESVLKSTTSKLDASKWDLIVKINKIYNGQCLLSDTIDNYFSFKMNFNILGGNLKKKMDEIIDNKSNSQLFFRQNITMPFFIAPLRSLIKNKFEKHEYYKMAFCYPINEINSNNYLNKEGLEFYCNIPISDQYIFNGPLKIKTFSDNIFATFLSKNESNITELISIYFTTEKDPVLNEDNDLSTEEEEDDDDDEDFEEEEEEKKNNKDEEEKEEKNEEEEKKETKVEYKKDIISKTKNPLNNSSNLSSSLSQFTSSSKQSLSSSINHVNSSLKPSSSSAIESSSFSPIKSSSLNQATSSKSSSLIKSSSSKISSSSDKSSRRFLSKSNLRNIEQTENKPKKYLLLDNRKTHFICPDKPIFEIADFKNGIIYKPILEKEEEQYNIILRGYLKNGYKILEDRIVPLEFTTEEIKFNLSITNNLVEEISEKRKFIPCFLSSGTFFLDKEIATIKCIGNKVEQNNNLENKDFTINWASKENKYLNSILIKWPKILNVHSKKIYSYKINALSIKKTDHLCFDDKYIFYINIFDLKSEPQIKFELDMQMPSGIKSKCKLYTSNMLKCYLDLRLKKIKKNSRIKLPEPGKYNITTSEGNYIDFTILEFSNENETNLADEGIFSEQTCGNYKLVGAIQDIGYGYSSAIAIIISILVIFFVSFLGIGYCIIYEINNRNKKGQYHAHTDEKKLDTTGASVNPITGTLPK